MIRLKTDVIVLSATFTWFLGAAFLSAVGRNGYNVACSWLLVVSGGGVASVATFFIASCVVEMLASPACGWICDHYNRRRVSVLADAVRVVCAVMLGLLSSFDEFYWCVWLSTIIFATCDRLSLTAMQSMIPHIALKHTLPLANSVAFLFMQIGSLVAAALIGVLLFKAAPTFSFLAIALFFGFSALCMMFVTCEPVDGIERVCQSLPVLQIDASLLKLVFIYSVLYTGGLLISAVGPALVFKEYGGDALDFGHLESGWSVGSILGAVLLLPLARLINAATLQIMVLSVTAISFASIKLSNFPLALILVCVLGTSYNVGRVAIEVSLQSTVPHAALGRAKGLLHCAAMVCAVAMLGMITAFPDAIAPTTIFLTYAGIVLACILGLAGAAVRNR